MLISAIIPFMSCARDDDRGGVPHTAYRYYFYESTGANKFILIDGVERKIEFVRATSNAAAVESLLSLKWNVLYPNSKGAITLFGTYKKSEETFTLIHWQLPAPFNAYSGVLTAEPGELKSRNGLLRSDFEKDLEVEPGIYNRPPPENR